MSVFDIDGIRIMIKRKIDNYIRHYYETTRNALLVTGARQTGKTFSIRQFGKTFKSFVEINFIERPEAVELFKGAKSSRDILFRLSTITSVPLIKGETLIFFDEVQQCPDIVTAIKFLVDDGSYRYILSGSLLGVELKDLRSEPVGYMGVKDMFPLDFEEFISCIGINDTVMQEIIRLYKRDITRYDPDNKLYIEEIFNLIPSELNARNKRFILKRLNEHAKFDRVENSFLWLTDAGVALPVYNVEEPKMPLLLARSRNLFKLFQNDIGLLASQYAEGIQMRIIKGDKDINFGSVYENAVAQELVAHGIVPYYYNNKKRGELDFVVELDGKVLPIEVKSGKDYETHRALSNIMACGEYDLPEAVVFNNDNLHVVSDIVYAPVYMAMFLEKNNVAPVYYKVDISGL